MTVSSIAKAWQSGWGRSLAFLQKADALASTHHTGIIWTLGILYKFALDALYIWAATLQYAYGGLVYQPSSVKYIVATGMYFILFAALPKAERSITSFLLHIQLVFTVAPLLSFYALSDGSSRYILMVFSCILLQTWIVRRPGAGGRPIHITGIQNYTTVALGVLTIFALVIPVIYNGFEGLKAFSFTYIYTIRENATYPPGFGYLLNWVPKVVLPFACLMFLHGKRYRLFALCVAFQILFYMETGAKITLFILVPVILVYYLAQTNHPLKLIYLGFVLLCVGVVVVYQLDRPSGGMLGIFSNSLIAIRAIFHPADNKFNFY